MVRTGFEDTIIRYFDGALSDADGAELLHRASVSPEIRRVMHEYEMLHEMAQNASRAVMVSPAVEASLFAKITSLAPSAPLRKEAAVFIVKRRTVGYAAALLLLIGIALAPMLISSNENVGRDAHMRVSTDAKSTSEPLTLASQNNNALLSEPVQHSTITNVAVSNKNAAPLSVRSSSHSNGAKVDFNESTKAPSVSTIDAASDQSIADIHEVALRSNSSEITGEQISPLRLQTLRGNEDEYGKLELSLQTASGFTSPADASPIKPFADERISLGYHLSRWDIVGARLGSGLFQQLSDPIHTERYGMTTVSRVLETKRNFTGEAFYTRLVPLWFDTPLLAQFSVNVGVIPGGYTFSGEAGLRLPISSSLIFDLGFALQSVHSTAPTVSEIFAQEKNVDGQPFLLQSSDVHRTLNGKLHYGILYTF